MTLTTKDRKVIKVYSKFCQTSKLERSGNNFYSLTIFGKKFHVRCLTHCTKFFIKDFFSKCHIWSHLLKKSLMGKTFFCAVPRFWIRLWIRYLTLPIVGHFSWIPNFLNKFFPIAVDINMNQRKITFSFSSKQKQLFADVLENTCS